MTYIITTIAFIVLSFLELYRSVPMSEGVFAYKKRWSWSEINWAYTGLFVVFTLIYGGFKWW